MDETAFVREIMMQPAALRTVAEFYSRDEGFSLLSNVTETIKSKRKLVFTGMGTSLYAPYLIYKELVKIVPSCEILDAGELLHFGLQGFYGDEVLLAVSQSGESAETKRVVQELKGKVSIVSIVNNPSSFIGGNSDFNLPLHAGEEASISTKTYTNTLAVLLLLSTYLNNKDSYFVIKQLHDTSRIMEKNLESTDAVSKQAASFFGSPGNLHIVARGNDLVTARQFALILKEGAGVFSEALSAGLFRHGPIELAGEGHSIIFIVSRDNEPELTVHLAEETCRMGSRVLVISDMERDITTPAANVMSVHITSPVPRYFPLLCVPFIEFFVHETAKIKGKEAGKFRHAAKITSRE